MVSDATSEALVTFGFPAFWIALGLIQWFWPAAIFPAFSNDDVTPGARGFAVLWLCLGAVLGFAFVPFLGRFGGWFVLGFVLLVVGVLQRIRPAWSSPVSRLSDRAFGYALAAAGVATLAFGSL